jgi:hypothetical protein
LFGYKPTSTHQTNSETAENQLVENIELINRDDFDANDQFYVYSHPDFEKLWPSFNRLVCTSHICPCVFNRLWCVIATSALVERVFSQSGLLMRSHRAKKSDELLETLMFLKCN